MESLDNFMFLYDKKIVCERTLIKPNKLEILTSEQIKKQKIESKKRIRQILETKTSISDYPEFRPVLQN